MTIFNSKLLVYQRVLSSIVLGKTPMIDQFGLETLESIWNEAGKHHLWNTGQLILYVFGIHMNHQVLFMFVLTKNSRYSEWIRTWRVRYPRNSSQLGHPQNKGELQAQSLTSQKCHPFCLLEWNFHEWQVCTNLKASSDSSGHRLPGLLDIKMRHGRCPSSKTIPKPRRL